MKRSIGFLIVLFPLVLLAGEHDNQKQFFLKLAGLEFEAARQYAMAEPDKEMQFEMLQLHEILFYEGQKGRGYFKLPDSIPSTSNNELSFIRTLSTGYISLFYDRTKGNAYQHFYHAYQLGKEAKNPLLIKAALLALLKYYNFEIAQNSDAYKIYLEHFETLCDNEIEKTWLILYKMIFYSKEIGALNKEYYQLSKELDKYERSISKNSPLLARVFFEKALKFEMEGDRENSVLYFKKNIEHSKDFPFLRDDRFFSFIKLSILETEKKNFSLAKDYLVKAKREINIADTLRSSYYLNLFGAHLYNALNENDTAYTLLRKAYVQEYQLDFRRNTLEVNRLNVELETQEKENANLKLRADRVWLITALVGVALLLAASYFAYANQQAKNKIQLKEKEMQALELEKMLKDQEVFGIDAMIEGQEKERQRIANDLHDNLGSSLATIKLHFQNIRSKMSKEESDHEKLLQTTDELLEETYQKVRGIAHAGNAGVNAQEGLVPAVKNFASKVSIINRLTIDVEEHGMNSHLENSLEITIFRIIQELVTNIIKHAQANQVVIHLTQHEDSINLMVEDNGIGFDVAQIKPSLGMGLYSIQKKIENIGGRVTIESINQKGTTVIIDIPLA